MKRNPDEKVRKVEEALMAAHREPGAAHVPKEAFERDVMFQIRQIKARSSEPIRNGTDLRAVWRVATVTGIMALVFLAYSLNADLSGIQFAESVVGDPATMMLVETFAPI